MRQISSVRGPLIRWTAAAALCVLSLPALAQDLSGDWRGRYSYDSGGRAPVKFAARIRGDRQGNFSGRMVEEHPSREPRSRVLRANIRGRASGGGVSFTKRYDGAGGVGHAVRYRGRIDRSGAYISGRWRLAQLTGRFEMRRAAQGKSEPPGGGTFGGNCPSTELGCD